MVVAALAEAWIWIYASRGRRLVDRDLDAARLRQDFPALPDAADRRADTPARIDCAAA